MNGEPSHFFDLYFIIYLKRLFICLYLSVFFFFNSHSQGYSLLLFIFFLNQRARERFSYFDMDCQDKNSLKYLQCNAKENDCATKSNYVCVPDVGVPLPPVGNVRTLCQKCFHLSSYIPLPPGPKTMSP